MEVNVKWLVEIEQVWATGVRQARLVRPLDLDQDHDRKTLAEEMSMVMREMLYAARQVPEGMYYLELRLMPIKELPVPATAPPAAPNP
jgi:hypothetical protein